MIDPRPAVIERRLAQARRVFAVTGGKGGIGKSVVASLLALALAQRGRAVGLLDLDLTGPCDHLILGAPGGFPAEQHGVEPVTVAGLRFMSLCLFAGDHPAPLRGGDLTDALLELLAITRWGALDALVVDLPPGLGDTALDLARLLPRAEYLIVATSSRIVLETVRRTVGLLVELGLPVAGVIENMARGDGGSVERFAREAGLPWLGRLPWDDTLEAALGRPERLAATPLAEALAAIGRQLVRA